MKIKCENKECSLYDKEVTIEEPTYTTEPKYGLQLCNEQYCEECGKYCTQTDNHSKGPMVKVSNAQGRKSYG